MDWFRWVVFWEGLYLTTMTCCTFFWVKCHWTMARSREFTVRLYNKKIIFEVRFFFNHIFIENNRTICNQSPENLFNRAKFLGLFNILVDSNNLRKKWEEKFQFLLCCHVANIQCSFFTMRFLAKVFVNTKSILKICYKSNKPIEMHVKRFSKQFNFDLKRKNSKVTQNNWFKKWNLPFCSR